MSVAPYIFHGRRNFRLSTPEPELITSRTDVDVLTESWLMDRKDAFVEGAPHPEYPGMIIDQVRTSMEVPGHSYVCAVTALGDARGSRPTKIVGRSDIRTLDSGWDECTVDYLTWYAVWRPCTAAADTNRVSCDRHGFRDGQRILFRALVGGAPLVPASSASLGTVYFVIGATPSSFQVAATRGGAVIDLSSEMTSGLVMAAEFAAGATHPEHPFMFLVEVRGTDDGTDWRRVTATYRGLVEEKPYKRTISCNGQQMSSGDAIVWDFPDGWVTPLPASVNLPKVVCTDVYLSQAPLATHQIPLSQGEGATPPDPPAIRSVAIFGPLDRLTYHWPSGWSRVDEGHVDSIPGTGVSLKRRVTEYVWPVTIR